MLSDLIQWWGRRRRRLRFVQLRLKNRKHWWSKFQMNLTVVLGTPVTAQLIGHSAVNGANLPEGATVSVVSNDTTVATVPATVPVPSGGAPALLFDVTVLGAGATDIHVTVTTPEGVFEDTATLVVTPLPLPGLVRVELTLQAAG